MILAVLLLAAATPTPRPVATVPPTTISRPETSGLAGAMKGRRLNRSVSFDQRNVPDAPVLSSAAPKPGGTPAPGAIAPAAAPVISEEQSWRDRKRKVDADVAAAKAALDAAEETIRPQVQQEGHRIGVVRNADGSTSMGWVGTEDGTAQAVREAALAPYRTRYAEAVAARDRLPEECRRSPGCQPGWVR
jgi:hypothetical protein